MYKNWLKRLLKVIHKNKAQYKDFVLGLFFLKSVTSIFCKLQFESCDLNVGKEHQKSFPSEYLL